MQCWCAIIYSQTPLIELYVKKMVLILSDLYVSITVRMVSLLAWQIIGRKNPYTHQELLKIVPTTFNISAYEKLSYKPAKKYHTLSQRSFSIQIKIKFSCFSCYHVKKLVFYHANSPNTDFSSFPFQCFSWILTSKQYLVNVLTAELVIEKVLNVLLLLIYVYHGGQLSAVSRTVLHPLVVLWFLERTVAHKLKPEHSLLWPMSGGELGWVRLGMAMMCPDCHNVEKKLIYYSMATYFSLSPLFVLVLPNW